MGLEDYFSGLPYSQPAVETYTTRSQKRFKEVKEALESQKLFGGGYVIDYRFEVFADKVTMTYKVMYPSTLKA